MAYFQRKPQFVEAIVWNPQMKYEQLPAWVRNSFFRIVGDTFVIPESIDDERVAYPGDYIINDQERGISIRSKKFFENLYEPSNIKFVGYPFQ